VSQSGTTTTYFYPFKWYSVASSTGSGAKFATTTDYVFNGDSLVATVDQQTASGNATGTAKTRYVHPDYLGSTNAVTDENGTVVQTLDYYPYGSTRISSATICHIEPAKALGIEFSTGLLYVVRADEMIEWRSRSTAAAGSERFPQPNSLERCDAHATSALGQNRPICSTPVWVPF
jgi:hypothetical protein